MVIKITGIIQMSLSEDMTKRIIDLQKVLPPEAKPLKSEDLHITLWKLSKPEREIIKKYREDNEDEINEFTSDIDSQILMTIEELQSREGAFDHIRLPPGDCGYGEPRLDAAINDAIKVHKRSIRKLKMLLEELNQLQRSNGHVGWDYESNVTFDPYVYTIDRPEMIDQDGKVTQAKRAWILKANEQSELHTMVQSIAMMCGIKRSLYELDRPFHVSIANLTGSPFDSVGNVMPHEVSR